MKIETDTERTRAGTMHSRREFLKIAGLGDDAYRQLPMLFEKVLFHDINAMKSSLSPDAILSGAPTWRRHS